MNAPEPRLYCTTRQVADELGTSIDRIVDLIHAGQLIAIDISTRTGGKPRWRISRQTLDQFIARRSSKPLPKLMRRKRQLESPSYY